jgi:transcriptional regulator with XRE-family HTH domain
MAHVRTVTPDGERIRELRLRRGLTVIELAKRTRRGRATIHHLEAGRRGSEVLIHQLALALGCEAGELIRQDVAA